MGDFEAGFSSNMILLASIAVISCVLLHIIIRNIFRSKKKEALGHETENIINNSPEENAATKTTSTENRTSSKSKKRAQWKGKTDYSHPWLMKNLKGHPGTVLLVDFSSNGKFMAATCDETVATVDTASIGARQLKQHHHQRRPSPATPPPPPSPPRIPVAELVEALQRYKLPFVTRWAFGYPLETENSTKAMVYVNTPERPKPAATSWDVNAPEFVPGSQTDSGRSSWASTPRSDSDEEAETVEHVCVRCDRRFKMTRDGEYVKEEACFHHWGRVQIDSKYSCCDRFAGTSGCTMTRFHVWNGTHRGMNGPLDGYVRARLPRGGVYAIDAEMCYTTAGLELAAIAVIAADGHIVYKEYVKPTAPVVDYNTRFSGIRPRDLMTAEKTLRDVQNDILGFVGTDTILIGHALENDLKALKLIHTAVVDTSEIYPHNRGYPLRRSLRALCTEYLGRKVKHRKGGGHSPVEDARAALDLVLLKIHEDLAMIRSGIPLPPRPTNMFPMSFLPYDPLICAA